MIEPVPPALIFLAGALVAPWLPGRLKPALLLLLPALGMVNVLSIPEGTHWRVTVFDLELILGRADRLSLLFANIYNLVTFLGLLYLLHSRSALEHAAALVYAGAALGVVMAGDWVSLFVFWELLTFGALFMILARGTPRATAAAYRYVLVHVFGGLLLLAGVILFIQEHGTASFDRVGLDGAASWLIFLGVGVNCAWPLLHAWLSDAYPEATVGGVVFMATFTTKTAVYVLARAFPGEPALVWIGVGMATFPIFYAVLENDLRRVLSYSLINQVGFMVVGIGIGTPMALNGAGAHAYCHILYKALLFMSVGAVLHQTGKVRATDLGGLYKSMPFTCVCCMIGAASISAFPLFSGFVSKSMVMSAAADLHLTLVWLALLFASAGVFHHAGIKIPFFAFFSHDSGIRVKEAPWNMRVAMGLTALLCVGIGSPIGYPYLYAMLPFADAAGVYEPYTFSHVTAQASLLMFSALAFVLLLLSGVYPAEIRSVNLDADWLYRRGGRWFYGVMEAGWNGAIAGARRIVLGRGIPWLADRVATVSERVVTAALTPYWRAKGLTREERDRESEAARRRVRTATFPIGVSALVGVGWLVLWLMQ